MNFFKGQKAEDQAVHFLKKRSYHIIARNYKTSFGEIDIIASINDTLCFVEVKSRQSHHYGYPAEFVNAIKQRKIIKTAKHFIMKKNIKSDQQIRFDVISVCGNDECDHLENAFFEK